jgi:trimeric autotransporter adhesin
MRKLCVLLATGLLCLSSLAHSQTRSFGTKALVLDDGSGNTVTIQIQSGANYTWTLPGGGSPPANIPSGTINNSTLRYNNGTGLWVENTSFLANGGALTATSLGSAAGLALSSTGANNISMTPGSGLVSITGALQASTNLLGAALDITPAVGKDAFLSGGATTGSELKLDNSGTAHFSIYNKGDLNLTFANTTPSFFPNIAGTVLATMSSTGVFTSVGNINSSGGALQTNGTTRIAGNGDATLAAISGTSITVPGAGGSSEHYGALSASAGASATAIGNNASAGGIGSVALGNNSSTTAIGTVALGGGSSASGGNSVAVGQLASVAGVNAVAVGQSASAPANGDVIVGQAAVGGGGGATAVGSGASATGAFSLALGNGSSATNANSAAIGNGAVGGAANTIQLGNGSVTSVNSNGSFNTTAGAFKTNGTTRIASNGDATLGAITASSLNATPIGGTTRAAGAFTQVGIGQAIGADALDVTGAISASGSINTGTSYSIGGSTVFAIPGTFNTFVGIGAGSTNSTGNRNAFVGLDAGHSNTTGTFNSFLGARSGFGNTIGNQNTLLGYQAAFTCTTGGLNTVLGAFAGQSLATGANNTFVGQSAGSTLTTENNNTMLGVASDGSVGVTNATALGAGAVATASNTVQLGNGSVTLVNSNGSFNTTAGAYQIGGSTVLADPGTNNIFVGVSSGTALTTGSENTFVGGLSGNAITSGIENTLLGYEAGQAYQNGVGNVSLGFAADLSNVSGQENTTLGWKAGYHSTGDDNTFVGATAGWTNTTGIFNTAIGISSDVGASGLVNATVIGANAVVATSNTVQLGDGNVTRVNSSGSYITSAGFAANYRSTSAAGSATINATDHIVQLTGGGTTGATMPTALATGQVITIWNTTGATLISGPSVPNNAAWEMVWDGAAWSHVPLQ